MKGVFFMYYKGICKEYGKRIDAEYAFGYALDRILSSDEEKEEFINWYYDGNWILVHKD